MRSPVALLALTVVTGHGCRDHEPTPIPATPTSHEPEPPWASSSHPIAGRVLTGEGKGVAGLELVAENELSQTGHCVATSDENGAFRFEVAEGTYTIRALSPGHEVVPLEHVQAGTMDLVITLVESARVSGIVIDPAGRPLAGFRLEVVTDEASFFLGAVVARKTVQRSSDGTFELGGLPAGVLTVVARADGFAPGLSEAFRAERDTTTRGVIVRLTEGGSIAAQVLDANTGLPIPGAEVYPLEQTWLSVGAGAGSERVRVPQWQAPPPLTRRVARTDSAGRFALEHLAVGPCRLQIQADGFAAAVMEVVSIEEGKTNEVQPVKLVRGAVVTGVVYMEGRIESGARVQLTPIDPDHPCDLRAAQADASGRFTFDSVPPNGYRIAATRANPGDDPFEAIGDIRRSEIDIKVTDGLRYDLDLNLDGKRR